MPEPFNYNFIHLEALLEKGYLFDEFAFFRILILGQNLYLVLYLSLVLLILLEVPLELGDLIGLDLNLGLLSIESG